MGHARSFLKFGVLFSLSAIFVLALLVFIFVLSNTARAAYVIPTVVTFTSNTSWTVPPGVTSVDVLVVGGGGGGGSRHAGGGGAGGFRTATGYAVTPGTPLTVTVGAGGAGGLTNSTPAANGSDSVFGTITATGGGGGGGFSQSPAQAAGKAGGSGGGASAQSSGTTSGGTGTAGQGSNGGSASAGSQWAGGGGGGAGAVGGNRSGNTGGAGGIGIQSSISGSATYYAGGGGGAGGETSGGGAGGTGGGGAGTAATSNGGDATANSGGGGGGSRNAGVTGVRGGNGGSGVVVVSYVGNTLLSVSVSTSGSGPLYPSNSITYTFTRNGPSTYVEVPIDVTLGGTAISGTDYSITNVSGGVVTIPANTLSTTVTVTALASMTDAKTFTLSLPSSSSYNVVLPSSYSVNMAPAAASLSLSASFTGSQVNVIWSGQYVYSCTVTGPNSFSASGTSGSQTTTPGVSPATYTLSCNTPLGTQQTTATALAGSSLTALKSGMVSYWTLDSADTTGTTANDVSTNFCNPGTLANAPTATAGHYGDTTNALSFNGSSNYVVTSGKFNNTAGTWSAWVKAGAFINGSRILHQSDTSGNHEIQFNTNTTSIFWSGYGTGYVWQINSGTLSTNTWYLVTGTYDGSTARLYINGSQVGSVAQTGPVGTANSPFTIGKISHLNSGYFSGSIDEVMVYNRALSASEVSQLYTLSATDAASLHGTPPPAPQLFPIVEVVPGYSMQSLNPPATYGMPIYSNNLSNEWSGNADGGVGSKAQPLQAAGTPSDVSAGWYVGTPSPLTCYISVMGKCMWFGGLKGTRIALVTATPQISDLPAFSAGVDLVSNTAQDICGRQITHWAYATSPPTYKVPKYTPVQANYSCQPTQEYLWAQFRDYSCWPVSCNASTISQRIFRFADRLKFNGTASSPLYGTSAVQTVSTSATFNLQCGGYLPEEGTTQNLRPSWPAGTDGFAAGYIDDFNTGFAQASDVLTQNIGLPAFYGMNRHPACWTYCYWPWTWAYYNVASTTYYHAPATINVEACAANERVVSNVCTACGPNEYISGNSCITSPPPTATIEANNAGFQTNGKDGVPISVVVGQPVTVTATYAGVSNAPMSKTVYLTSTSASDQTWTVPSDWNSSNNKVEVIASGASGGVYRGTNSNALNTRASGGGGGAYSAQTNITLTPGGSATYRLPDGGASASAITSNASTPGNSGADAWFNGTTLAGSSVGAKGGVNGAAGSRDGTTTGGAGGDSASGVGSVKTSGGKGGNATVTPNGTSAGGGGGAGGPTSNGVAAADASNNVATGGGNGGSPDGGIGSAGSSSGDSSAGGAGTAFQTSPARGTGGGSGGSIGNGTTAARTSGAGGLYGAGSGGAATRNSGGATGNATSGAGGQALIVITYLGIGPDPLTATAINDDSVGTGSVDCTKVTPSNPTNCWTIPDVTKTYTFTSILNDLGLHTYSAQIKTNFYTNYNGYASVDVTFTCWPHSTQQGASCVCDPHYSQVGNSCVLDECTNNIPFPGIQATVPPGCIQNPDFTCQEIPGSGYEPGQGECAPPGQIADLTLKVSPPRVKKGNSTLLTWTGTNVPAQCTVSSNPSIIGLPKVLTSTITGNSTGALIGPIMQNTLLTLTCTSITANGSAQKAVGIVPVIIEI